MNAAMIAATHMADASRDVESMALKLAPNERARLAQRLISSLDKQAEVNAEISTA